MKGPVSDRAFATRTVHAGAEPEPMTGAVVVPIFQTSTYVQKGLGEMGEYDYARGGNPTRKALELAVTSLEGGARTLAFSSGMAAITALLTKVGADQRVVISRNVYGGTYRLIEQVLDRYRLRASWVDTTDLEAIEAALGDDVKLLFLETPTNPMMDITDIAAASELAHRHGIPVAVDNTFMSPYFQRPLELGADYVVHSTTKFLNGHSDSIGGVLVSRDLEEANWFHFVQKSSGAILGPFDCFLTHRGIKTLAVRMERHETNARRIAEFLDKHLAVEKVFYPGLEHAPGHALQSRQASGFGALIAFDLGSYEHAKILLGNLEVFTLAESLGGVESLISHPASMTHAAIPAERQAELGITPGLVRISVGIEEVGDLLSDLAAGLENLT